MLRLAALLAAALALSGCETLRELTARPEYEVIPDSYGRPRVYRHP